MHLKRSSILTMIKRKRLNLYVLLVHSDLQYEMFYQIREDLHNQNCSFLNIVQKAFDPTPLRFEHYIAKFFDGFFKKRVKVCRDIFGQNKA